jgi:uncharacterized protein
LTEEKAIEIRRINKGKRLNIKGGIVLDGFPSTGLVNAIASECLIRSTVTELVAVLDSPYFPPVSIISNYIPQYPARIYVNEGLKVSFFISELNIDSSIQKAVAKTILKWATENECRLIISAEGIVSSSSASHEDGESGTNSDGGDKYYNREKSKKDSKDILINKNTSKPEEVFAVSSTLSAAKIIKEYANYFTHLRSGSVTGIPAILLNEGTLRNLDVIVFLVNVLKDTPDFRAAAVLSEAVSRLIPNLSCDIGSLLLEAELVRNKIKAIRDNQARLSYIA